MAKGYKRDLMSVTVPPGKWSSYKRAATKLGYTSVGDYLRSTLGGTAKPKRSRSSSPKPAKVETGVVKRTATRRKGMLQTN